MADILLTGANGQLGSAVVRLAPTAGLEVVPTDSADLDITDAAAVRTMLARVKPSVVINAAAYTAVDKAEEERDAAYAVNRDGPAALAEACAAAGVALIHVSTDYVFDGAKPEPYTEDDPTAPLGVYGASKVAGEDAVRAGSGRHVILRTAWVYGLEGGNFVKTMLRVGAQRDQLRVVDDQFGTPTFADDLADAALKVSRKIIDGAMPTDGWGTFHCAGQGVTTWCRFARRIFACAAPHLPQVPEVEAIPTSEWPTPAARPANSALDCRRLAEVHGITLRPWQEALDAMLDRHLNSDDMKRSTT